MTRHFEPGQRVRLRPDRADAYGLARDSAFIVLRTAPNQHYKRTWVVLAEQPDGNNVVDSRELRAV